jgi:predicted HAD superfamily Cof-like phosphohydrolase
MKNLVSKVYDFHRAFGVGVELSPTLPDAKTMRLRYDLAKEELDEFMDACQTEDCVKIFDALVDQLYILIGTAHAFGMADALEAGFAEVHRSNMTKLDANGKPVYREDGKVIKSELFEAPDLDKVLREIYSM